MSSPFIKKWLKEDNRSDGSPENIAVFRERTKGRELVKDSLRAAVLDNLVGADIIASIGGFAKAAKVIQNALPAGKISRSGDFGEILATEVVAQTTKYTVPVRRLRYKDDRAMAMRGDDVLAFDFDQKPLRILKTEAKSRAKLSNQVLKEAVTGLARYSGRPNPSTLSFISRRLREQSQNELAELIESLQEADIPSSSVSHLIFTVSGNEPLEFLKPHAKSSIRGIARQLMGCVIPDHAAFIQHVFDSAMKEDNGDGNT